VRKLLSIGIVLALLVTFIVPVVVAAQDECCGYTPAECGPLPDKTTKTLAGAAVWTMLGVSDIMGKAVCATTGQLACNLGGWSDELGVIAVDVAGTALTGLASLLSALGTMLGMEDIFNSIGDILKGIGDAITAAG
jgi:hypothetical protein